MLPFSESFDIRWLLSMLHYYEAAQRESSSLWAVTVLWWSTWLDRQALSKKDFGSHVETRIDYWTKTMKSVDLLTAYIYTQICLWQVWFHCWCRTGNVTWGWPQFGFECITCLSLVPFLCLSPSPFSPVCLPLYSLPRSVCVLEVWSSSAISTEPFS